MLDAKLVRSAKARVVAQIGFYSDLLAGVQGIRPRWMHLAPGSGEFSSLKVDDYAAYERQARRLLTAFTANDDGENPPTQIWAFDRQADTDPQKRAASATLFGFHHSPHHLDRAGHGGCRTSGPGPRMVLAYPFAYVCIVTQQSPRSSQPSLASPADSASLRHGEA